MASVLPKTSVVLLSCGSFNPITFLHLRMFEIARDSLHRTGVFTVIKGIFSPVHDDYKKKDLVKSEHRIAMCKLGVETSDWLCWATWEENCAWSTVLSLNAWDDCMSVDQWESKQPCWQTTAKVLDHFTEEIQKNYQGPVVVKLLCGADLLESFAVPNLWTDEDMTKIVDKHGLVVISRQGSNPESFIYESDVLTKYKNNIHIVTEWITNDVSATKVRRAIHRGESVKYLIPDTVFEYIKNHKLYAA